MRDDGESRLKSYLIVVFFACAVFIGCMASPPSLQDDVDSVQAQIARNMLTSGDWVTARLDGIPYLEKPPLLYWMIALCYRAFGVHDWAARIPVAFSGVALCWLAAAFGTWAFGRMAGRYAGVCLATCVGLFLFTRVQIPDVILTLTTTLALWAFLRAIDEEEQRPRLWAFLLAASLAIGLLLKSLIGVVFPMGAALVYLAITRQLWSRRTWSRLRPLSGAAVILLIAAPWHVLAMLRNPPLFDFTPQSIPGQYHGFFWFFFMNEQVLRFLNLRYPRDYNTVPRVYFWLFQLLWLFPWSMYLPAAAKLSYRPVDRAGKTRLLSLICIGVVMVFFTFSTTQEYYSMPCYPSLALLIASAMVGGGAWARWGSRAIAAIAGAAAAAVFTLWFLVRHVPTPGDISAALVQHPGTYTLSLGHMGDLTLGSFAYLRAPLLAAGAAFVVGLAGTIRGSIERAFVAAALMMTLFFQAARMALIDFDPFLSSRPIANALMKSPPGELIVDHHYYTFSSVFFYTGRNALLRNGRINNLVYGSYAPGAPNVFIDDAQWTQLWEQPKRCYLVASELALPGLQRLVTAGRLHVVLASGSKMLLTNLPLPDGPSH